jgi:HAD superfamily hydrolase (TIGR01509 family)
MASVRGILFDVDGTLLDSNDAHAEAWAKALAEHGFAIPFAKVRPLIGKGGDKLLPELTGVRSDEPIGQAIERRRAEIFRLEQLPRLRVQPGARALVAALRARGLAVGIATSAKEDEVEALLKAADVADLVDRGSNADDADRSKPDPDIVHAALERLGLAAHEVMFVGDTPYDVTAGLRAGVATIALRCGGWDDADLTGAVAVYEDPADLLDALDDSALEHADRVGGPHVHAPQPGA